MKNKIGIITSYQSSKLLYFSMFILCALFTRDYYYVPTESTPLRTMSEIRSLTEENFSKNSLKEVIGYNVDDENNKYTLERRKAFRWLFLITQGKIFKSIIYISDNLFNKYFSDNAIIKTKFQAVIIWLYYGIFLFIIFHFMVKITSHFSLNDTIALYFCYFIFMLSLYFILGRKEGGGYNYNVFETVFITLGLYFSLTKKKIYYGMVCIFAPLIRESGIIISIFYSLINSKSSIIKNKNTYIFPAISFLSMIIVNFDVILDMLNPKFLGFFGTQGQYVTIFDLINGKISLSNIFNALIEIYYSYLIFIIFLTVFYTKSPVQKKIGIIISIYLIIFLLTTPIDQLGIRFLIIPLLTPYIYIGLKETKIIHN